MRNETRGASPIPPMNLWREWWPEWHGAQKYVGTLWPIEIHPDMANEEKRKVGFFRRQHVNDCVAACR